jgi:starch synthase
MHTSDVPPRARLALVHHANQQVITELYADRDGIGEILGLARRQRAPSTSHGLLSLLQMHLAYRVPLNLHMSGTLVETVAWHCPEMFPLLRRLRRAGLLEMIGSTSSQNIMPFFSDEQNIRQMEEELWLYRRHLGCDPAGVTTFWCPSVCGIRRASPLS